MKKLLSLTLGFGLGVLTSLVLIYFETPQPIVMLSSAIVSAVFVAKTLNRP